MAVPAAAACREGKKLFGRAFYESIGSPRYVLAPMVDHSEAAWRMLSRSFLPDSSKTLLAYSPMLHSRLFSNSPKYRAQNFEPLQPLNPPSIAQGNYQDLPQQPYLDGSPALDRPLIVQFCSNSPDDLLAAAKLVEPYCDAVDLNLGCPQGIARRGHYGSFLQEDWDLIYRIIKRLHQELSIPVTAKIRILETKEKTLEYANMVLSAGASILTVHGRQRDQKGHNTGLADWTVLRYLRDNLPEDTVIFANGNVLQYGDLEKCLQVTGADAVMSAEANLADPTVFATPPALGDCSREYWRGRNGRGGFRMDAVLRRYIDIICKHVAQCEPPKRTPLFMPSDGAAGPVDPSETFYDGPPPDLPNLVPSSRKGAELLSVNLRVMQSHLFHMLRPLVAKHTDIRDHLAKKCKAGDIGAFEEVLQMVERAVKRALLDYEAGNESKQPESAALGADDIDEDDVSMLSSAAAVERCRRPYFICQPYVRPLPQEALEKGAMTLSKKEKERQSRENGNTKAAGLHPGGMVTHVPLEGHPERQIAVPKEAMVNG